MEGAPSWLVKRQQPPAGGEGQGSSKSRRLEEEIATDTKELAGKDGSLMRALVSVLARLTLTNARELAEVTGSVYDCFLVGASLPLTREALQAGKDYSNDCKSKGKDHGNGPPWVHIFVRMIQGLAGMPTTQGAAKEALNIFWRETVMKEHLGLDFLQEHVRMCKLKPTYFDKKAGKEPTQYKMTLCFSPLMQNKELHQGKTIQTAMAEALKAAGATRKLGSAPRGGLERDAARLLRRLNFPAKKVAEELAAMEDEDDFKDADT